MALFYACSTKHVKKKVRVFCLLCLLDHAKVKTMNKASRAAQTLSKLGASKGGKARAGNLTPEQRKAIAQKAAKARWAHKSKSAV